MSSSDRLKLKERSTMRAPLWLAGLGLLALGACASSPAASPKSPPPITPSERYGIEVEPSPLELKLGPHAAGLSPTQVEAMRDFIARWNDADRGMITIKAPSHAPNPAEVYRTAAAAHDFLVSQGVPSDAVQMVGYDGGGDPQSPVVVGFLRYMAKGPVCGTNWGNLANSFGNDEYKEFGCSVTANIAAQIANPADLLHPRDMTPSDASRRQAVLDKYRQGTTTSTAKDAQANGAVSTVVGAQ
jgi:pilus assembly protein CpaD